jgi:hypothetical protein
MKKGETVYILVIEDRHVDTTILPFESLTDAIKILEDRVSWMIARGYKLERVFSTNLQEIGINTLPHYVMIDVGSIYIVKRVIQ